MRNFILIFLVVSGWILMIVGNAWIKGLFFNFMTGRKSSSKDAVKTGFLLTWLELKIKDEANKKH